MKFRKAYIEITNKCNLSCDFCPKTSRESLFMDDGMFDSACAQLRGRVERLHLHVMGEPLLHPHLEEYLDICAFYGHRVSLITNGVLLSKKPGLAAKPALRLLGISLHSCSGQLDDEGLRSYLEVVKNIAAEAAGSSRCVVQMRLWNMGAAGSATQPRLFRLIEETFRLTDRLEDKLKTRRSLMLGTNLCLDSSAPFQWPSLQNNDYGGRGTCYGLRRQCAVLADGTLTACCLDNNGTLNLGNLREDSLADILSGKRAAAMREGFERGIVVESLCRKCSYRLRFAPASPRPESSPHA